MAYTAVQVRVALKLLHGARLHGEGIVRIATFDAARTVITYLADSGLMEATFEDGSLTALEIIALNPTCPVCRQFVTHRQEGSDGMHIDCSRRRDDSR